MAREHAGIEVEHEARRVQMSAHGKFARVVDAHLRVLEIARAHLVLVASRVLLVHQVVAAGHVAQQPTAAAVATVQVQVNNRVRQVPAAVQSDQGDRVETTTTTTITTMRSYEVHELGARLNELAECAEARRVVLFRLGRCIDWLRLLLLAGEQVGASLHLAHALHRALHIAGRRVDGDHVERIQSRA